MHVDSVPSARYGDILAGSGALGFGLFWAEGRAGLYLPHMSAEAGSCDNEVPAEAGVAFFSPGEDCRLLLMCPATVQWGACHFKVLKGRHHGSKRRLPQRSLRRGCVGPGRAEHP